MGGGQPVKNAADSWVNQNAQAKNYNQKARLFIRSQAGNNKYAWLYFNKPWPNGATIISAKLRLYSADAWGGSTTLTIRRAAAKWNVNKINYNNMPGVTGAAGSVTQSGTSAGEMYEVDVTSQVQEVANGANWYGFRVETNRATDSSFHSAQSPQGGKRPTLIVIWSDAPDQPTSVSPSGGRFTSLANPTVTWDFSDVSGDQNHLLAHTQIGVSEAAVNAGTVTWDSGPVPSDAPQTDLSVPQVRTGTGTTASASNQLTAISASMYLTTLDVGSSVTGPGIPGGATITAVNVGANSATMSANAGAGFGTGAITFSKTYAGVANDTLVWSRHRSFDGAGLPAPWSLAVQWGRASNGTLTMTSPAASPNNFIWEGSPTVSWTFTGRTQRAFQVAIALTSDPENWLWDSGKITSTDTSIAIPFLTIKDASVSYRILLRVWDTVSREAVPGAPVYVELTRDATINYDNTVSAVTSLAAQSDALYPVEHLTFTRTVAPDYFQLQRSEDAGVTWQYRDEKLPAEITAGGNNYAWDDIGAAQYTPYVWRVVAIVGGRQSGTNPTVSGEVRRIAPFLLRPDGSDAVCFLNPVRDRQYLGRQEVHERLEGAPVLVTQSLGGQAGHVEGRLTGDPLPGVTAKVQKRRFLAMRKDSGQKMKLAIADETLDVIAYNMNIDTITDASGITYTAEFDWIEV